MLSPNAGPVVVLVGDRRRRAGGTAHPSKKVGTEQSRGNKFAVRGVCPAAARKGEHI